MRIFNANVIQMIYKFFKSLFPQNDKRAGTPAPDLRFARWIPTSLCFSE